jgi:serine/threonine protein kinase
MEYCGGGDLLQFVKSKGRVHETEAKQIFKQIIQGARVCHTNYILHRDFKLDNILLDEQLTTAKICDFGVSKIVKPGRKMHDQCGTPAYLAPEIILD